MCGVIATGSQNKRHRNYADGSMSPDYRQDMIYHRQTDVIPRHQRDDLYSPATSSGHSWSSSPDMLYRPTSALRNSPTVYVLSCWWLWRLYNCCWCCESVLLYISVNGLFLRVELRFPFSLLVVWSVCW